MAKSTTRSPRQEPNPELMELIRAAVGAAEQTLKDSDRLLPASIIRDTQGKFSVIVGTGGVTPEQIIARLRKRADAREIGATVVYWRGQVQLQGKRKPTIQLVAENPSGETLHGFIAFHKDSAENVHFDKMILQEKPPVIFVPAKRWWQFWK